MSDQVAFKATQRSFVNHLRDPDNSSAPEGIEDRRLKIYRDLIYNNIESFISSGFPILRSLFQDAPWRELVRDFIRSHSCETPYFLEISQEFLRYLHEQRDPLQSDPPFMMELAHYEWVELALDISLEEFVPLDEASGDMMRAIPEVSPLAWRLSYQYPVHRIGPNFQPQEPPEQPTFLVVYRNRQQQVKFLEANQVTFSLLQILEENQVTGEQALAVIAKEMAHPNPQLVIQSGAETLAKLQSLDIIY